MQHMLVRFLAAILDYKIYNGLNIIAEIVSPHLLILNLYFCSIICIINDQGLMHVRITTAYRPSKRSMATILDLTVILK